MEKSKKYPTDGELEILQILWKEGPSTVKTVNELLSEQKEVGYTTTLKLMQIMHEKGLVLRERSGKSHIYKAAVTIEHTRKQVVDKVLKTAFQGSAMKLVMQVLGNTRTSKQEINEIKKFLDDMEIEKGGDRNE